MLLGPMTVCRTWQAAGNVLQLSFSTTTSTGKCQSWLTWH